MEELEVGLGFSQLHTTLMLRCEELLGGSGRGQEAEQWTGR